MILMPSYMLCAEGCWAGGVSCEILHSKMGVEVESEALHLSRAPFLGDRNTFPGQPLQMTRQEFKVAHLPAETQEHYWPDGPLVRSAPALPL